MWKKTHPWTPHLIRTPQGVVIVGLGLKNLPLHDGHHVRGLWCNPRHRLSLCRLPKWAHPSQRSRSRLRGAGRRAHYP
jgi:hypothetical protein